MKRSNVYDLLANRAADAEIRAAICNWNLLPVLEDAYGGVNRQALTFSQNGNTAVDDRVVDEIDGFMRLVCGSWAPQAKKDFLNQCLVEFAPVPLSLLLPAIAAARRAVFKPERFVSWIFERIEKPMRALEEERAVLQRLMEIAADAD